MEEDLQELAAMLELWGTVRFEYCGIYYEIFESTTADGYMVNLYLDNELDADGYYLDDNSYDGGLCTGTALEAIEFMLKEEQNGK